jgi:ribonuclease D
MYSYTMIDTDAAFRSLLQNWKSGAVHTVAMDFEGEFNLHIYGEHLCLIQLYDTQKFYLVDPLVVSMDLIKEFLEDASIQKIMFDCASDSALMRKQYKIQINNICDIRIHALALGHSGGLTSLVDHYLGDIQKGFVGSKKKNQRTNWLKRPLRAKQIQYALDDVAHLFALKEILETEVEKAGVGEEVAKKMESAGKKTKGEDRPPWSKFSSWKYLNTHERTLLKHFFLARDKLARKYNIPAARILDRQSLLRMAKDMPQDESEFYIYCGRKDPRNVKELVAALMDAKEKALSELA